MQLSALPWMLDSTSGDRPVPANGCNHHELFPKWCRITRRRLLSYARSRESVCANSAREDQCNGTGRACVSIGVAAVELSGAVHFARGGPSGRVFLENPCQVRRTNGRHRQASGGRARPALTRYEAAAAWIRPRQDVVLGATSRACDRVLAPAPLHLHARLSRTRRYSRGQ